MARIALVVATKNRAGMLKGMLNSLYWQDMDDWECIVISDRCTDQTKTMLANWADKRIKVYESSREGKGAALNFAKLKVASPLVKFFDDDDYLLPNSLRVYAEMMEETGADMGYSGRYTLLLNNQLLYVKPEPFTLMDYINHPMLGHGSLVMRTLLYKKIEHDDTYPASIDFDFICKCAMTGARIAWTEVPLYIYRNHPESITFASNPIQKEFYNKTRDRVLAELKEKPVTNEVIKWKPTPIGLPTQS